MVKVKEKEFLLFFPEAVINVFKLGIQDAISKRFLMITKDSSFLCLKITNYFIKQNSLI